MEDLARLAKEGVLNLVGHCAQVKPGEKVVVVNERGKIEEALLTLITDALRDKGALCTPLWVEPESSNPPGGSSVFFPRAVIEEIVSADKVISSIRDEVFFKHLSKAEKVPLVVTHLFSTLEDMASEHARYHWAMGRAIYDLLENDIFRVGASWKITSPSGTEISGSTDQVSTRTRYRDEQTAPFLRSFHSGAYRPVATAEAEGVIVCEYTGGASRLPCYDPPVIYVEKNEITRIEGGRHLRRWLDQYRSGLEEKVQRFGEAARVLDSWHGGANPKAECIPGIVGNGGTRMMHFHLGRTTGKSGDYLAAEISHHTLEIDGKKVYENGKLAILEHPKVKSAAATYKTGKRPSW